ncbi:MAG TPA: hypothetical protein P5120_07735 [Spirochaetota bacterium]|nr:hypothetical protein [Spirochaetota bacterium]
MNFIFKNKRKKIAFIVLLMAILAFTPEQIEQYEFPVYRVVIDPGHGGVFLKNKEKHGDKFDLVTGKYIDYFAEGASLHGNFERDIVFSIGTKVMRLMDMCAPEGDFEAFRKILSKYTDRNVPRIYIDTMISREDSVPFESAAKEEDPNAPYRLYDYPDAGGEMQKGRISKINGFRPHLVVSLHLAKSAPPDYKGLNGIIVPPYNVLKEGFVNLRRGGKGRIKDYGILKSWFKHSVKVPYRLAYFRDCAQYFTGYSLKKNYSTDYREYKGYKYNMVSWIYRDPPGWHIAAREHKADTQYSDDYMTYREEGPFREREKSVYETYRRGESFKNFGGDNYFATYEIIKFVLQSLDHRGVNGRDKIPGKPFISTWSVPLLVNAVSAYIELGYLNRKWDRDVLLHRQDEIAEGVAAGIYSLLAGMGDIKGDFRHKPSGTRIDFDKYKTRDDRTYFDIVVD